MKETPTPDSLRAGSIVGSWRIEGYAGRGSYGLVFRARRVGAPHSEPMALKMAAFAHDLRFLREGDVLSRFRHPAIPRLLHRDWWIAGPHTAHPYLVLEWIRGRSLYEWARVHRPTARQVLHALGLVAGALEVLHQGACLHRDVKGSNVLVRWRDGRALLTDFGAGHYRGAASLTSKLLPPGTPAYRSPEAWEFLRVFRRHPTVHYPASACDDLFALGGVAYRLVTDEYPPLTDPEERGAEVWREGGPGPRAPSELSPRVSEELDALILRLLARAPDERFEGRAVKAAEALEQAWKGAGPQTDSPLFGWGTSTATRLRSPGRVRRAEEQDAAAREEHTRQKVEDRPQVIKGRKLAGPRAWSPLWGEEMAVALVGLLLAVLTVAVLYRGHEVARTASGSSGGDIVAVGDSASGAAISELAPMRTDGTPSAVGLPMPDKPFPGQRTPPCTRHGEVEIRGGCWYALRDALPPCREDAYDWNRACYLPSYPARRHPTTQQP